MKPIHTLAIAGSLRRKSYNRALLCNAQHLLPEDMTLEIYDLDDIPFYNSDVEREGIPTAVQHFHDRLAAADALLIATPEYNFSVPGVLKNALDWASRKGVRDESPINGKPVAIIGAGGGMGTVRAQMHLRDILIHNDLKVLGKPALMVSRAWSEFDENGKLINPEMRERLQNVLIGLRDWTRQLNK